MYEVHNMLYNTNEPHITVTHQDSELEAPGIASEPINNGDRAEL